MKKNKTCFWGVWLALFAVITLHSCKEDAPVYEPAEKSDIVSQDIYFPDTNAEAFELEPSEPTQITLKMARNNASGAANVPLKVELNTEDVFVAPSTVSFAAGEKEKEFTVTFPTAKEGIAYTLRLSVEGEEYVSTYGDATPFVQTKVTRIKWEPVEKPMVYVDGTFSTFFGVSIFPMYVNAEKATLGKIVRYRFKNAYGVPTDKKPDADGIYDGYVYNDPGDFDETKDYYTVIEISDNGDVYMFPHQLGVIWSYGMFSIGSVNETSFGKTEDGVITFPQNTLFISMSGYKDGAKYKAGTSTIIYTTKELFIAANKKIKDFNEVEYKTVEGEVSEFMSEAYKRNWKQTLSQAIDIDEENEESDYKNLYYLSNLYADDYGLAFYFDPEEKKVKVVEEQPIGTTVFGKDLYVSQSYEFKSSMEVNDKGVTIYTFGLKFHYKDGTILGDFAEKFFFSKDAVSYEKTDFIGDFVMTGKSQFEGKPDGKMDVKIAEGEDPGTFILTGVKLAKEVKATFNAEKSVISIAPQTLADFVIEGTSYDATLYTTTKDKEVSGTAVIDLTFNMSGNLAITPESEADGYLIRSETAGGWVSGYYDLMFTPKAKTKSTRVAGENGVSPLQTFDAPFATRNNETIVNNFKIQGKIAPKTLKQYIDAECIYE